MGLASFGTWASTVQVKAASFFTAPGLQAAGESKPLKVTAVTETSDAPRFMCDHRELDGLAGDDQAVVGTASKRDAMGGDDGVLIIALLDVEAEVDFVARGIGETHRRQLRAEGAECGETGFDGRGGAGVIAGGEGALRALARRRGLPPARK